MKKMMSLVLEGINDLRYEERDIPSLKNNEVLLKIKNCGICSSDIERVFVNGTYHFPTIPGHEFCGEIVDVNNEADKELIGKKACVFPLLPCFECDACQNKEYAQCRNYSYFGSRCDGAFSEYLAVPKWNLIFFDGIDFDVAALCEPTAVANHAFNRVNVKKDDSVLIMGSGTIGIILGIIAKSKGANVYIAVRNDNAKMMIESLDINTINSNNLLKEMEHINLKGFNYVFEAVGSNESIANSILACDNFGSIVVIGNPKDDLKIDKNTYWKILRKQLTLTGTWNSSYTDTVNDWKQALEFIKNNQDILKKIITHKYSLSEFEEAFAKLVDKNTYTIKVMFENK